MVKNRKYEGEKVRKWEGGELKIENWKLKIENEAKNRLIYIGCNWAKGHVQKDVSYDKNSLKIT